MEFTPVNELERLLLAGATDPAARPAFYRGITEHPLFVITEGPVPEQKGEVVIKGETSIRVRKIEMEGKMHTPIFTSVERISAVVPQKVGYLAVKGSELLSMLRGSDLILNPGSQYGKFLPADEVESIIDGSIFHRHKEVKVEEGQRILLGQPQNYPHHVTDALKRYFERTRDVRGAYLAHAFRRDVDPAPHTLIGLDVTGDWKKVIEEVGIIVREVTQPGEMVDFVRLDAQVESVIEDYLRKHTKPFYRRKWLGLF